MPRQDSESQRLDVASTLKRQHKRFVSIVGGLRKAGMMPKIQGSFDRINELLSNESNQTRRRVIAVFTRHIAHTLLARGADPRIVASLTEIIQDNWLLIIETRANVNLDSLLENVDHQWKELIRSLVSQRGRASGGTTKSGFARLVVGGGAVVFDAAKFLLVFPVPEYMFSSFLGGTILFFQGLDRVLEYK